MPSSLGGIDLFLRLAVLGLGTVRSVVVAHGLSGSTPSETCHHTTGFDPVSPALAGRVVSAAPPGMSLKSLMPIYNCHHY